MHSTHAPRPAPPARLAALQLNDVPDQPRLQDALRAACNRWGMNWRPIAVRLLQLFPKATHDGLLVVNKGDHESLADYARPPGEGLAGRLQSCRAGRGALGGSRWAADLR